MVDFAKAGAGSAYRLVPAILGGGGETVSEAAALQQAAYDVANKGTEARGDMELQKQNATAANRRADNLNELRRSMVGDAEFEKLTPSQKRGDYQATAPKRKALLEARRTKR